MKNVRMAIAVLGLLALVLVFQPVSVDAHSPAGVDLEYNSSTDELTVTVDHVVSNVNTHYVEEIIIEKNSVQVASRDYTSQDTTSGMTDTFTIEAEEGDVLRATAICNIAGQLSAQITVTATTTTDPGTTTTTTPTTSESTTEESTTSPTGDGQPPDPTLLILGAVGAVAILAVILVLFRRR